MPFPRISKEKRVFIISALAEGNPITGICRMFHVGPHAVLRLIEETGAALADYMHREFRDLPCARVEMDEQWQFVHTHGQRMDQEHAERGDFWLWAAVDADTKLVFSYLIAKRDWQAGEDFVADAASRVSGPVQVTTDPHRSYAFHIPAYFGGNEGYSYATEKKAFELPFNTSEWAKKRKNGVAKIAKATRRSWAGQPDLKTATTSHIERVFLTMRQEVARFGRLTLAHSKKLSMHKAAVSMHLGLYNLVRRHQTLGTTPAAAAGVELKRWTLEDVVELVDAYVRRKEDAKFEAAFAALEK